MQPVIFDENELRLKCLEWQKILRLQDWDVRTSIARASGMRDSECNAEMSANMQHKLAVIRILDPIDFDQSSLNPQDMERALVHELLHIHLWPFTLDLTGSLVDAEEQALNMIANALIALYRNQAAIH